MTSRSRAEPPELPPLFNASAESLISETEHRLTKSKAVQDAVLANVTPDSANFGNTILPLVQEENHRLYERQLAEFYGKVSTDEKVRDASLKAARLYSDFDVDTGSRGNLYKRVTVVRDGDEALSTESCRLVERLALSFEQNGLGLSPSARARMREIDDDLDQVRRRYLEVCDSYQYELWLTRDELEGLGAEMLDGLEGDREGGPNHGKLRLVVGEEQFHELLANASRQETRRQIYTAKGDACRANEVLLKRGIVLRDERARLLGYSSFAESIMAGNMEESPLKIQGFLEDLLDRLAPIRDERIAERRKRKADDLHARGEEDDGKFYPWDLDYYSRDRAAPQTAAAPSGVRSSEYFALDHTIEKMLYIFETVMGLAFHELDEQERERLSQGAGSAAVVWHQDVKLFAVWDDSPGNEAEFLGYLYMDMHPRPGKQGGASDQPIRPAFTDADGSRKYTSTGLICNFPKPTSTKPCLLPHHLVVLLFHELGHGIHDLVANTQYARFHGASTSTDFNEAPSQMLEQWCYDPHVLGILGQHYSTLSPDNLKAWQEESKGVDVPRLLPREAIQQLVESKKRRTVTMCLTLLKMSLFDLAMKSPPSHREAEEMDTTRLSFKILQMTTGCDIPDDPTPVQAADSSFFDVSGMYSYLVCLVYSLDMFHTAFSADPMSREQGLRYRRAVIGKGSSADEKQMLIDFLGRPPNAEALYQELGLA